MLVLTRRVGECIRINDEITITILAVRGLQTKVGIAAPPSVSVDRQEIYVRKQADKSRAQRRA